MNEFKDDYEDPELEEIYISDPYPDPVFLNFMADKAPITLTEISAVLAGLKYGEHNYFTYDYKEDAGRMSYPCCSSCGRYGVSQAIQDEGLEGYDPDKYLFFNVQTFDSSFFDGKLCRPLHFAWDGVDPEIVRKAFWDAGRLMLRGGNPDKSLEVCGRG